MVGDNSFLSCPQCVACTLGFVEVTGAVKLFAIRFFHSAGMPSAMLRIGSGKKLNSRYQLKVSCADLAGSPEALAGIGTETVGGRWCFLEDERKLAIGAKLIDDIRIGRCLSKLQRSVYSTMRAK